MTLSLALRSLLNLGQHGQNHNATPGNAEAGRCATDALTELQQIVTNTYSEELWRATKAALAVIASLSLKGRSHPLALIFEGASGKGKSTVINMCNADREATKRYVHRIDKFTPASFISQAANVSKELLAQIDLLPKLKDKVLLTKELAPLFRGRDDALREIFATLTTVLDGKGYVNTSGAHGERGTHEDIIFNWLGATTPIPARTDGIMAQLGNRLLRYEIIGEDTPEEDLIEFLEEYRESFAEDRCRELANTFIENHFSAFPVNSVDSKEIEFPHERRHTLARYARLISAGRVEVEQVNVDGQTEYMPGDVEGPARVALLLQTYARGYALVSGTMEVGEDAISSVAHIALSCIPRNRRKVFRLVLSQRGQIDSTTASRLLNATLPTVRNYMKELAATGLVKYTESRGNTPLSVSLADEWQWPLPRTVEDGGAERET
jgi:hypothetical protein